MALNIKTEEAHELARALAEETGETLTDAVTEALRDRLARVRAARRQRRTRVEDVLAIGRRCAATVTGPAVDHGLAKTLGQPLLFKGEDFARTDVTRAIGSVAGE